MKALERKLSKLRAKQRALEKKIEVILDKMEAKKEDLRISQCRLELQGHTFGLKVVRIGDFQKMYDVVELNKHESKLNVSVEKDTCLECKLFVYQDSCEQPRCIDFSGKPKYLSESDTAWTLTKSGFGITLRYSPLTKTVTPFRVWPCGWNMKQWL